MDSPTGQMGPFSPLFNCMPYKVFWNAQETSTSLQLPLIPPFQPHRPPFYLPPGHAVSPSFYPPHAFFGMLAHDSMMSQPTQKCDDMTSVNLSPTVRLLKGSVEGSPHYTASPVTPPLTPLLPDNSTANIDGCSTSSSVITVPTRSSSRSRRPPAFIEGESSCPICGALLRASELAEHYTKEMENLSNELHQPSHNRKKKESRFSERLHEKRNRVQDESRKNVLARVKHNRKSRALKYATTNSQKGPMYSRSSATASGSRCPTTTVFPSSEELSEAGPASSTCPVCNKLMNCSNEELTRHVEGCLSKNPSDTSSTQDASGSDEEYETYTWCGQTRVRATSFLDPSELAASGFNTVIKGEEDDDTPLIVDDDDESEQKFGETQYSEADVIPCTSEEPAEAKAQSALREAVLSSSSADTRDLLSDAHSRWTDEPTVEDPEVSFRCLICMDKYSKPVISVRCWHVHCEECWLRTLGAKKLCPQCNNITSPSDLRRIYL